MIRLHVAQMEHLMLGLAVGLATLLLIVLGYLMLWRPRLTDDQGKVRTARGWRAAWQFVPWALILVFAASTIYMAIYAWFRMNHPPTNW